MIIRVVMSGVVVRWSGARGWGLPTVSLSLAGGWKGVVRVTGTLSVYVCFGCVLGCKLVVCLDVCLID